MISSASTRAVVGAVGAMAPLLLLQCNQSPAVVGGSGGSNGAEGGSSIHDDAAAVGGSGGSERDADPVIVKLDSIPAWWIEADAYHEPDLPPPPTTDANCGQQSSETVREYVDVLLVLDRSASMDYSIGADCYCTPNSSYGGNLCSDTANCTTRWNAIKPAVQTTLSDSKLVNWGLKLFATPDSPNCGVSKDMEVPIDKDTADAINTRIDGTKLSLSTPTAAAIVAATDYLKTSSSTNKKFILLATDGEPNCGDASDGGGSYGWTGADVAGASRAAAAAQAAGFPVYVVGIGPNLGNLTALAQAGGTNEYYPVSSPDELTQALSSIGKAVGSCSFQSKEAPPDPENVAVYVNKQLVEKGASDGWRYGASSQEIVLTGSYCDHITAGEETTVQILFGCKGAPPFPPFVP